MKTISTILFVTGLMVTIASAQGLNFSKNEKLNQFEVQFTMYRNLIIVQGEINNQENCNFIFDTGTNGILLNDSIVKFHNLKAIGSKVIESPNGNVKEKVKSVIIPSLKFNGLNLKNIEAIAVKPQDIFSPNAIGIIGISAFNGYIITIDYQNTKLIFKKGELKLNNNSIPIEADNILEAKINLNGKKVLAHFDCGAPGYIAIPMEWKSELKLKSEPVLIGKGKTPGGEFEVYASQLDGEITIGKLVLKDTQITLVTSGFPAINLGMEFFKKHSISIDGKNKLLQIESDK